MAFAAEVTAFFDSTVTAERWTRSAWRRSVARALHPDRWLDTATGSMWRGERAARLRGQAEASRWEALRTALKHQSIPHLNP